MPSGRALDALERQNRRRARRNQNAESMHRIATQSQSIKRIVERQIAAATRSGEDTEPLLRVLRCATNIHRDNERVMSAGPDTAAARVIDASQIRRARIM